MAVAAAGLGPERRDSPDRDATPPQVSVVAAVEDGEEEALREDGSVDKDKDT